MQTRLKLSGQDFYWPTLFLLHLQEFKVTKSWNNELLFVHSSYAVPVTVFFLNADWAIPFSQSCFKYYNIYHINNTEYMTWDE